MSITPEEQRKQLAAVGWEITDGPPLDGEPTERIVGHGYHFYHRAGEGRPNWLRQLYDWHHIEAVLEAIVLTGLPIPGYRIIREEGER